MVVWHGCAGACWLATHLNVQGSTTANVRQSEHRQSDKEELAPLAAATDTGRDTADVRLRVVFPVDMAFARFPRRRSALLKKASTLLVEKPRVTFAFLGVHLQATSATFRARVRLAALRACLRAWQAALGPGTARPAPESLGNDVPVQPARWVATDARALWDPVDAGCSVGCLAVCYMYATQRQQ